MTTYGAAHAESWAVSLRDNVFPVIIAIMEKKGYPVTMDELFACLNMTKPTTQHLVNSGPEIPSYLGGNASHRSQSEAAPSNGGSKGKSNKEPYTGPTCQYIFTKGAHKNEYCGAQCAPGNPRFCKACSRKKAAGGQGTTTSSTSTASSGAQDNSDGDSNVLDAISLDESKGLYREVQCNLLIQQDKGNTYALGVITDPGNLGTQLRPLNDKEKLFCSERNITIADQDLVNKSAPVGTTSTTSTTTTSTTASSSGPGIPGLGDVESILRGLQKGK